MQQLAMDSSQPRFEHFALILAARFADSPSLHLQLSTDSKIGKFWTGMSKKDEREQAEIVLEVAFGEGPNGLSPDDARYVHDAGRGMKENDYDQFLKCFKDTLKDINKVANIIPKEKVDEAVDNFNKFKKSFVK
jgi:truncated hemoglobin YjbI